MNTGRCFPAVKALVLPGGFSGSPWGLNPLEVPWATMRSEQGFRARQRRDPRSFNKVGALSLGWAIFNTLNLWFWESHLRGPIPSGSPRPTGVVHRVPLAQKQGGHGGGVIRGVKQKKKRTFKNTNNTKTQKRAAGGTPVPVL